MINPNRQHDRKSFFKYMPADTAKIVLINKTLRWSSPLQFNDPFDVPREIAFNISSMDMQKAINNKFIELIHNPPENLNVLRPRLQKIIKTIREQGTPELRKELVDKLCKTWEQNPQPDENLDLLRDQWREMIPRLRILCLSEKHDAVSMWYHYADEYKGVVIELLCKEELDSAWLIAKPVQYGTPTPNLFDASGWADISILPFWESVKMMHETLTHTKSEDWSYEKEWRVTSSAKEGENGRFTDYKFNPREIGRIFFGPNIEELDRTDLLNIISMLPSVIPYDSLVGMDRNFTFKEITS